MASTPQVRQRSRILGTPVFRSGTTVSLGLVNRVWIDPAGLRVVGLGLQRSKQQDRPDFIPLPDVVMVSPSSVLLPAKSDAPVARSTAKLTQLVGQSVQTLAGLSLGKIKDFTFDLQTGAIASLLLSASGIPLLPGWVDSTFVLSGRDLVPGDGAIVAAAGAEARLTRTSTALLERWFGLGRPRWQHSSPDTTESANSEPSPSTPQSPAKSTPQGGLQKPTASPQPATPLQTETLAPTSPSSPNGDRKQPQQNSPLLQDTPVLPIPAKIPAGSPVESSEELGLDSSPPLALTLEMPTPSEPSASISIASYRPLSRPAIPRSGTTRAIPRPQSGASVPRAGGFREPQASGRWSPTGHRPSQR
jgi:uncharacterized protein YrrD